MTNAIQTLLAEPRAPDPPARVWRDWVIVAVLLAGALAEGLLREDLVWQPLTLGLGVVLVFTLLWRRTSPLAVVVLAFGATALVQVAALASDVEWRQLAAGPHLILAYALFRWGSGREAALGLAVMLGGAALGLYASFTGWGDVVGGSLILLFPAALGASVRYRDRAWRREREQVQLLEREQLARELHDTVAHHVSAIAIQAQAGRAVAATRPDAAVEALGVIEEAASRTLSEMRGIVGALRGNEAAERAPQPALADLERLARAVRNGPRITVELSGELDDLPRQLEAALYRLAQESITNALRHARGPTRVDVHIAGRARCVRLTVRDDGATPAAGAAPGHGLLGMSERAKLLGGTLEAGPGESGGWTVRATLPRDGTAA